MALEARHEPGVVSDSIRPGQSAKDCLLYPMGKVSVCENALWAKERPSQLSEVHG